MKTILKTAKFTFKTAFARCVAANAVVVSCISVAKVAKWWCNGGGCVVWLRWFLCVIQAVARLICGENAVRKRQNAVRKWRKYGAKTAKWWCICGVYMLDFLHFVAKMAKWWCDGGGCVMRFGRFQP